MSYKVKPFWETKTIQVLENEMYVVKITGTRASADEPDTGICAIIVSNKKEFHSVSEVFIGQIQTKILVRMPANGTLCFTSRDGIRFHVDLEKYVSV
jgi:hypothetical protein